MKISHSTHTLAGLTLHRIDFDADTFSIRDLFWLPHHQRLRHAGRKRQSEHLAGRLAAFYALRDEGINTIPGMGECRQPQWPASWNGSITHSGETALAVISPGRVGIDLETIFTAALCDDIADNVVNREEQTVLYRAGFAFPLALTLAFSAKESLYKALSFATLGIPGFASATVVAITAEQIVLQLTAAFAPSLAGQRFCLHWQSDGTQVVTLLAERREFA